MGREETRTPFLGETMYITLITRSEFLWIHRMFEPSNLPEIEQIFPFADRFTWLFCHLSSRFLCNVLLA